MLNGTETAGASANYATHHDGGELCVELFVVGRHRLDGGGGVCAVDRRQLEAGVVDRRVVRDVRPGAAAQAPAQAAPRRHHGDDGRPH